VDDRRQRHGASAPGMPQTDQRAVIPMIVTMGWTLVPMTTPWKLAMTSVACTSPDNVCHAHSAGRPIPQLLEHSGLPVKAEPSVA
jgi:hypothetical protein